MLRTINQSNSDNSWNNGRLDNCTREKIAFVGRNWFSRLVLLRYRASWLIYVVTIRLPIHYEAFYSKGTINNRSLFIFFDCNYLIVEIRHETTMVVKKPQLGQRVTTSAFDFRSDRRVWAVSWIDLSRGEYIIELSRYTIGGARVSHLSFSFQLHSPSTWSRRDFPRGMGWLRWYRRCVGCKIYTANRRIDACRAVFTPISTRANSLRSQFRIIGEKLRHLPAFTCFVPWEFNGRKISAERCTHTATCREAILFKLETVRITTGYVSLEGGVASIQRKLICIALNTCQAV